MSVQPPPPINVDKKRIEAPRNCPLISGVPARYLTHAELTKKRKEKEAFAIAEKERKLQERENKEKQRREEKAGEAAEKQARKELRARHGEEKKLVLVLQKEAKRRAHEERRAKRTNKKRKKDAYGNSGGDGSMAATALLDLAHQGYRYNSVDCLQITLFFRFGYRLGNIQ